MFSSLWFFFRDHVFRKHTVLGFCTAVSPRCCLHLWEISCQSSFSADEVVSLQRASLLLSLFMLTVHFCLCVLQLVLTQVNNTWQAGRLRSVLWEPVFSLFAAVSSACPRAEAAARWPARCPLTSSTRTTTACSRWSNTWGSLSRNTSQWMCIVFVCVRRVLLTHFICPTLTHTHSLPPIRSIPQVEQQKIQTHDFMFAPICIQTPFPHLEYAVVLSHSSAPTVIKHNEEEGGRQGTEHQNKLKTSALRGRSGISLAWKETSGEFFRAVFLMAFGTAEKKKKERPGK